jgi:hypothetical protein
MTIPDWAWQLTNWWHFVLILDAWNDLLISVLFFRNEWELKFGIFQSFFLSFSSILGENGEKSKEKWWKNATLMMYIWLFAKKPFLWAQKGAERYHFSLVSHLCHTEWPYIWEEGWEELTNISQQLTNLFPFPAHHPRPCPILYRQASLVGASRPRAGASPQRISKI